MSNYIPILGDIYTRKNGKKYEVLASYKGCEARFGYECAFTNKQHCNKVACQNIVYVRRKDLEQQS